jgi:hypothetical protein
LYKWLLPTISEVLAVADAEINSELDAIGALTGDEQFDRDRATTDDREVKAQQQWYGAISALSRLLEREVATMTASESINGLLLYGGLPVDLAPNYAPHFSRWKFISELELAADDSLPNTVSNAPQTVRVLTNDPIISEQFCLFLTPGFSLVMGIGEDATGETAFHFSFDPKVVKLAMKTLRSRITLTGTPEMEAEIDDYCQQFPPVAPNYKIVMLFSQLCLKYQLNLTDFSPISSRSPHKPYKLLTASSTSVDAVTSNPYRFGQKSQSRYRGLKSGEVQNPLKPVTNNVTSIDSATPKRILEKLVGTSDKTVLNQPPGLDVELLQAIAHEVRTPLTTIRTLTRLLLKRRNLDADIIKRLETIDRECSEQIDRFSLIFRAVELETCEKTRSLLQLSSTSLGDVFSNCIPRWQKQASRRNLTLDVILPPKMPPVVTDPTMLDQVLTGALENFISSVPGGSAVQVKVMLAGHQLKMQLHSELKENKWAANSGNTPPLKSIGQLLMFQPETGNISLNLSTTKNLFHALGGKLIVRKRSQQGQVLTIFLPLEA